MSSRRWPVAIGIGTLMVVVAAASAVKVLGAKTSPAFKTENEKASYAIGLNLARQLKSMASDLDERALAQGFNDGRAASGKTKLTNQEIATTLGSLRKTYQQKAAAAMASAGKPASAATATAGISVYFKLDPRLTASYGGDRWVSPPTYTRVGDANSAVIEARAQARSADPKVKAAGPQWTPSDPSMIQVTPDKGGAVTITVKRPGTSNIRLTSDKLTKDLAVNAETRDNALQVAISQK